MISSDNPQSRQNTSLENLQKHGAHAVPSLLAPGGDSVRGTIRLCTLSSLNQLSRVKCSHHHGVILHIEHRIFWSGGSSDESGYEHGLL